MPHRVSVRWCAHKCGFYGPLYIILICPFAFQTIVLVVAVYDVLFIGSKYYLGLANIKHNHLCYRIHASDVHLLGFVIYFLCRCCRCSLLYFSVATSAVRERPVMMARTNQYLVIA